MRTLPGHLVFFIFLVFYIFCIQYFGPSQDFDTKIVAYIGILCSFCVVFFSSCFKNSFFYFLSTFLLLGSMVVDPHYVWADPHYAWGTASLWWVSVTLSKIVSFDKRLFNFWPYFCLLASIIGFIYYEINNYPIYTFPFNWHNQSAIFLGTSIPFWVLKIYNKKNKQELLQSCSCMLFIFYCIFLTGSKAGIAVCFASLIFAASIFGFQDDKNIFSGFFSYLKKIRFFLIFGFVFLVPKIYNNIVGDFSFQSRIAYFKGAFEMGLDNPLNGVGWGNFKFYYPQYQSKIEYAANDPHSWLFRAWAEGGFVGIILVFILVSSVLKIFKNLKNNDEKCFFIAAVMILLHGLFDFHATFMPLPLLVGCFLGFSCRRKKRKSGFMHLFYINSKQGVGILMPAVCGFFFCLMTLNNIILKPQYPGKPYTHYAHIREMFENRNDPHLDKNIKIRQFLLALDEPQKSFITREERLLLSRELLLIDGINRPEFALIFANESLLHPDLNLEQETLNVIDSFLDEWPRFNDKEELFSFKLDARSRKLDIVFANLWEIKSILEKEKSQKDLALIESKKFF